MSNESSFYKFMGVTRFFFDEEPCNFFDPYHSASDCALRATSIVTAPIICSGVSLATLPFFCFYLLKYLINTVILNSSQAQKDIEEAEEFFVISGSFLIAALLSPLINLIDFVGSMPITTLQESSEQLLDEAQQATRLDF